MSRAVRNLSAVAVGLLLGGLALALVRVGTGPARIFISDSAGPTSQDVSSVAAGRLAPDFKLVSLDGQAASLSALRGKVVFLNLWATWCPPCREEMPSIQALSRHFQKNTSFVILTVSEDSDPSRVGPYIRRNNFNFPVLLDPRNQVAEAYDVSGLPESFVIGRDGRIVVHHVGPYDWSNPDIREALQDLIKAKAG